MVILIVRKEWGRCRHVLNRVGLGTAAVGLREAGERDSCCVEVYRSHIRNRGCMSLTFSLLRKP